MKGLRQGFQAGIPGRDSRQDVTWLHLHHKLSTQALSDTIIVLGAHTGPWQQHRDQNAAAAQMQMKTIPGTGTRGLLQCIPALCKRCPGCSPALPLTWFKREMKEVSLCLQHQLRNSLGTLGKAGYPR